MALVTLQNLVLKTVTVGDLNRLTPADRIGQGTAGVVRFSAGSLSPYPASESEAGMREAHRPMASAPPAPPAGPAGCLPPGSTARRNPSPLAASWRCAGKRASAATGRSESARSRSAPAAATTGRDRFPRWPGDRARIGSDCQSPDRSVRQVVSEVSVAAITATRTWESTPAPAAGK